MVFSIAVPMTLAFLTTPILGIVDTAVIGQFGDAALIGGLAVGAIIFDIVFTTFNFLRSGTTGFVAQAFGREDEAEQQAVFWRADHLAAGRPAPAPARLADPRTRHPADEPRSGRRRGHAHLCHHPHVRRAVLADQLRHSRPAARSGQGGTEPAAADAAERHQHRLSIYFGLVLGWAIEGVALGTVLGEAIAAAAGFWWIMRGFDRARAPSWAHVFERPSSCASSRSTATS
jgi:MATE family multidrug resistance protein